MKKVILSVFFVAVAFSAAFSQGNFSAGLELALPLGTFSDAVGIGFGATARYEAPIQDKLSWMGTTGFVSFTGKTITIPGFGSIKSDGGTLIPIQGGVKYYFQEASNGFYASGELGVFIFTGTGSETKFGFSPGVGYRLEKFDFSGRFQIISNANYLGARVAYVF
jgi:hypothetical protein